MRGLRKTFQANRNARKQESIFVSDKTDLKAKAIKQEADKKLASGLSDRDIISVIKNAADAHEFRGQAGRRLPRDRRDGHGQRQLSLRKIKPGSVSFTAARILKLRPVCRKLSRI